MVTAVILAGGNSWRLKPDTDIPKPLLKVGKETLLSLQAKWLLTKGFEKILIVTSPEVSDGIGNWLATEIRTKIIVENERRGTAGAVSLAIENLDQKLFYVCNVDDLIFESIPMDLLAGAIKYGAAIRAAKPKLQFGRIYSRGDLVLNFKEKPGLDFWVSCGHYAFNLDKLNGMEFPQNGSLEDEVLPKLAKARKLDIEKYRGTWISVNTFKDYMALLKTAET